MALAAPFIGTTQLLCPCGHKALRCTDAGCILQVYACQLCHMVHLFSSMTSQSSWLGCTAAIAGLKTGSAMNAKTPPMCSDAWTFL